MKGRLIEYIKLKYKIEEKVKYVLMFFKDFRDRVFDIMKKEGIFMVNN